MWQRSILIALTVLAGLALLAGCGQSLDSLFSTYNIDMTGKTIDAAGGAVHLVIPPNAVTVPTVPTPSRCRLCSLSALPRMRQPVWCPAPPIRFPRSASIP